MTNSYGSLYINNLGYLHQINYTNIIIGVMDDNYFLTIGFPQIRVINLKLLEKLFTKEIIEKYIKQYPRYKKFN